MEELQEVTSLLCQPELSKQYIVAHTNICCFPAFCRFRRWSWIPYWPTPSLFQLKPKQMKVIVHVNVEIIKWAYSWAGLIYMGSWKIFQIEYLYISKISHVSSCLQTNLWGGEMLLRLKNRGFSQCFCISNNILTPKRLFCINFENKYFISILPSQQNGADQFSSVEEQRSRTVTSLL